MTLLPTRVTPSMANLIQKMMQWRLPGLALMIWRGHSLQHRVVAKMEFKTAFMSFDPTGPPSGSGPNE